MKVALSASKLLAWALSVLLVGLAPGLARAQLLAQAEPTDPPPAYAYDGTDCQNAIATIAVDAARARALVPPSIQIPTSVLGKAALFVTFTSCDTALNGGASQRVSWSDAGVLILAPDGSVGTDVYWLWNITDSPAMAALDRVYGIPTEVPSGLVVSYEAGSVTSTTYGDIPWSLGAYSSSATYEDLVVPPAIPGTVVWWRVGPAGTVRFDQAFQNDTEIQGLGTVSADPAGQLGQLAGASNTTEFMLSFADLVGSMRVVYP